jgi:alkanesulfonate monooxygenase SsuD/methylene tetrahydromethanopterin reductase-like flavin-dependent oxidoreductase (luciferase family)
VDVVSSGRLEAGVGLGWSRTEYAASGVPFAGRGKRYEEFVHCVDALLRGDGSGFTGTYYTVPAATYLPRPVQQPRPPLYLGGGVETAVRRAAQLADGWISSSRAGLAGITRGVQWLRRYADGRPARAVARGVVRLRSQPAEERDLLEGTVEDMTGDLRRLADIGVDEVFLDLNFDPEVGTPAADPDESMRRCRTVLAALAP